jgi:predicted nuclease of restriction endonuclease-like (RecB) superfamily
MNEIIPESYGSFLKQIKERIASAQIKAALAVNRELVELYWQIGSSLLAKQEREGWGAKTIERLARDLKEAFPGTRGFSFRNLKYMVQFVKENSNEIRQQLVAQIPWGHNIALLQLVKNSEERLWYVQKTIQNGWSRNVLIHWISSDLYKRQGKAITNFKETLPEIQSDLARETRKDPYKFDFLALREKFEEKELEDGLLNHIQHFLLELGAGFAFVGRQYKVTVSDTDYYIDLLFYHLSLRCYVVIELKATEFKPEYAGKMNFYLSAVDDLLRHPEDRPTIGMILCKTKDAVKVEYALRDVNKPIGVSGYEVQLIESLPDNLKCSLPSVEELEQELEKEVFHDI